MYHLIKHQSQKQMPLEHGFAETRTLPIMFQGLREKGSYASAPATTYAKLVHSDNRLFSKSQY